MERDYFIAAIQAIASEGVDAKTVRWSGRPNYRVSFPGSHVEHTQSNYISVTRYLGTASNAKMEVRETTDGGCERALTLLGAAAGAISGIGGGFFGVLQASGVCDN